MSQAYLVLVLAFNVALLASAVIILRDEPRWSIVLLWCALAVGFGSQVLGGFPSLV